MENFKGIFVFIKHKQLANISFVDMKLNDIARAKAIASNKHCRLNCLLQNNTIPQATEIVLVCLKELESLSFNEKKDYLRYSCLLNFFTFNLI